MWMSLREGQVTPCWAPTTFQLPPALRSSHQAVPWAPVSQRTTALSVADVAPTFVAGLGATPPAPGSSARSAMTSTGAEALRGKGVLWGSGGGRAGGRRARRRGAGGGEAAQAAPG